MVPFEFYLKEREVDQIDEKIAVAYLPSFAIGILFATPIVSIGYFLMRWEKPKIHFKVMILPGIFAGTLWSLGNFCSLQATLFLGNSLGYPLTQTNIIVSGLFGIFYFKEIKGVGTFSFFFFMTCLFGGVVLMTLGDR